MKRLTTIITLITLGLLACNNKQETNLQKKYSNIIDIAGIPEKAYDLKAFGFSDMGAWHAYSIPPKDSTKYYGSFVGPMVMKMYGQWPSKALSQLSIIDLSTNKEIDLSRAKAIFNYLPGKLEQKLSINELELSLKLIFTSARTSLIITEVKNNSNKVFSFNIGYKGQLFNPKTQLAIKNGNIRVSFNNGEEFIQTQTNIKPLDIAISNDNKSYTLRDAKGHIIKPNEKKIFTITHSYCFNEKELKTEKEIIKSSLENYSSHLKNNTKRWNEYISKTLTSNTPLLKDPTHKKIKIKTIETLISNWRSPAGDLKSNGVFPSTAYHGFYGFWSWDSWKHAVALTNFFPYLAKENIRSMFDYQDEMGMVADCIYFNKKENNWRDTKAPLATWAVWKIFEKTHDTCFIREMYPKLTKYHSWWYKYRDNNKNGICEYGSTDGTLIAAKWESGMDNAVRFDETKMLKNNDKSWSMNQESVDLNTYLYSEKIFLAQIAKTINIKEDEIRFRKEANTLKEEITKHFWDETTGFFYDRDIITKKLILKQQGTEGWIPLWANIANKHQAKKVMKVIMDTSRFNTLMPFPTLAANNKQFNPLKGYWRGPVWLDQAYFGIKALENYSYKKEASLLRNKLINNAAGLSTQQAIYENYHPISGKGLNAKHFSWSAAHFYLLLD